MSSGGVYNDQYSRATYSARLPSRHSVRHEAVVCERFYSLSLCMCVCASPPEHSVHDAVVRRLKCVWMDMNTML